MDRRLLLAGFAATLVAAASRATAEPEPRRIPVVARKFVFIPNEIALRQGESVVLDASWIAVLSPDRRSATGMACTGNGGGLPAGITPGTRPAGVQSGM